MKDIFIYDGEAAISRITFSARVADVLQVLEQCAGGKRLPVYIVADDNVLDYEAQAREAIISSSGLVEYCGTYALQATEEGKTMDTVLSMTDWLLGLGADRNAMVLAIGGGITTDMAGFAASIYKRGVRFAYIPTTLLAQVDAAIGGKTGVNFESYKNMLGVIRQPDFTFMCSDVLKSLNIRYFLSGASEMVKSFIIEDGGHYASSVNFLEGLQNAENKGAFIEDNGNELLSLIHAAASVKAGVVSRDQFESGERRKLNLGHTFAHAIEKNARLSGDDITHGEAVAIGMVMAAELSEKMGILDGGVAASLREDFLRAGLPAHCPYPVEKLVEAMAKDKKAENGVIHFVLIAGVGDVVLRDLSAEEAVGYLA